MVELNLAMCAAVRDHMIRAVRCYPDTPRTQWSVTQRLFLNFSERQVRVDGVFMKPRRRDAVVMIIRAPTRLARAASRRHRSTQDARLAGPGRFKRVPGPLDLGDGKSSHGKG